VSSTDIVELAGAKLKSLKEPPVLLANRRLPAIERVVLGEAVAVNHVEVKNEVEAKKVTH
jgi:hypothetical protein